MDRKIKVLWISDLVVPTGFSRVSHGILKYISNRIDFSGIGINYKGDPHPYDLRIFPTGFNNDIYGVNRLQEFVQWKPDIIFMLNDVWVIDIFLDTIRKLFKDNLPEIVCYFPVDAEEHSEIWYRNFDIVTVPVTYTEFGRRVVIKAKPELADKLKVIPHGVDQDMFYKLGKSRVVARQALLPAHKEFENSFVVLSANRNQPRKKLDITLKAFALFAEGKPQNVKLYMHCGVIDSSIDVGLLSQRYGMDTRLILTSLTRGIQRVTEEKLNLIYNSCDVGINTGLGEGWSLTQIEHAITGAPQVVPDHSACREIFKDCGVLVPAKTSFMFDNIMTVGKLVTPEDVAEALEKIYTDKEYYDLLSKKSIEKFSAPEYQWSTIAEQWWNIFEGVVK